MENYQNPEDKDEHQKNGSPQYKERKASTKFSIKISPETLLKRQKTQSESRDESSTFAEKGTNESVFKVQYIPSSITKKASSSKVSSNTNPEAELEEFLENLTNAAQTIPNLPLEEPTAVVEMVQVAPFEESATVGQTIQNALLEKSTTAVQNPGGKDEQKKNRFLQTKEQPKAMREFVMKMPPEILSRKQKGQSRDEPSTSTEKKTNEFVFKVPCTPSPIQKKESPSKASSGINPVPDRNVFLEKSITVLQNLGSREVNQKKNRFVQNKIQPKAMPKFEMKMSPEILSRIQRKQPQPRAVSFKSAEKKADEFVFKVPCAPSPNKKKASTSKASSGKYPAPNRKACLENLKKNAAQTVWNTRSEESTAVLETIQNTRLEESTAVLDTIQNVPLEESTAHLEAIRDAPLEELTVVQTVQESSLEESKVMKQTVQNVLSEKSPTMVQTVQDASSDESTVAIQTI